MEEERRSPLNKSRILGDNIHMSLVRRIYYRYTSICTNNKQVCGICGNDLFCRNIVLPTFFVYYYKILSVLIRIKYIKVIDNNFSQLLINVICQNYFSQNVSVDSFFMTTDFR